jgi:Dolichyl-phosphate-mannose-protein mannosyltransferase
MGRARSWECLAVLFLGLVLVLELGLAVRADGLTDDEVLYIPAGYLQLTASDFHVNPTAPPLASTLAALGLLGIPIHVPEPRPEEAEIAWAYRFVHEANDAATVIARSRAPVVALTLGLCLLVWVWARQSHGPAAGLLALTLAVFHPSLLAHGHLATTDLPAAFLILLGSWAFWRWSRFPAAWSALLVGACIGLAAATRLTAWFLVPSLAIVAAFEWRRPQAAVRNRRSLALLILAVCLVAPVAIWGAYGFHYAPAPGLSVAQPPAERLSIPGQLVAVALRQHALPEAYLEGVRYQLEHVRQGHTAYLLGWRSKAGWWFYFLVALVVKNTPGFLVAVVAAAVLAVRSRTTRDPAVPSSTAHWIVPAAVIFVSASASSVQIGERYILPVYPFLILFAAATLSPLLKMARARWLVVGVLVLHTVPSVWAAPGGYLSYFNALAGGRLGAHRVLLDSNLDWGQDLPRLAEWMRLHGVASVDLAYHGSDNPDRFGIRHGDLPGSHLYPEGPFRASSEGFLAISPNLLFGLVSRVGSRYADLRDRPPDDRAGAFFIFRVAGEGALAKSPSTR